MNFTLLNTVDRVLLRLKDLVESERAFMEPWNVGGITANFCSKYGLQQDITAHNTWLMMQFGY